MDFGKTIFFILGSLAAGILLGFLLLYILRKTGKMPKYFFRRKVETNDIQVNKEAPPVILNEEKIKPNKRFFNKFRKSIVKFKKKPVDESLTEITEPIVTEVPSTIDQNQPEFITIEPAPEEVIPEIPATVDNVQPSVETTEPAPEEVISEVLSTIDKDQPPVETTEPVPEEIIPEVPVTLNQDQPPVETTEPTPEEVISEIPATTDKDQPPVETTEPAPEEVISEVPVTFNQDQPPVETTEPAPEEVISEVPVTFNQDQPPVETTEPAPEEVIPEVPVTLNQGQPPVETTEPAPEKITPEVPATNARQNDSITERPKSNKADTLKRLEEIIKKSKPSGTTPQQSAKSDLIKELETNLKIANTVISTFTVGISIDEKYLPSVDMLPFQTIAWDSKHGENETLFKVSHQELIQLYVDIGLANNIVWLSTEVGHRSKELDESYFRLCTSIAECIKQVLPVINNMT